MGRVGALVLAVVAGLMLAGCTSDPHASVLPPVTETATPPGSASPTPSVEAEVEAAVRAYVAALNEAFQDGDTAWLRQATDARCPCANILDVIDRTYRAGGRMRGAHWRLLRVTIHDPIGASAAAEIEARVDPYQVLDKAGKVTESSGGGEVHVDYSFVRRDGKWVAAESFDLR